MDDSRTILSGITKAELEESFSSVVAQALRPVYKHLIRIEYEITKLKIQCDRNEAVLKKLGE